MSTRGKTMRRLLRRFGRAEGAVAAVEFALILPFLLLLYFGSMEASSLFTVDHRVNTISGTVGDLVAQWNDQDGVIPTATLRDYFIAAQSIVIPYSATGLKQVISFVQVNKDGTTKVMWSCGYNGGAARPANGSYPLAASSAMNTIARGSYVVAAETYYNYKPMMAQVFTSAIGLYRENFFMPRYGNAIPAPTCPT
jgi:Flp pilus assembly protein TadG